MFVHSQIDGLTYVLKHVYTIWLFHDNGSQTNTILLWS